MYKLSSFAFVAAAAALAALVAITAAMPTDLKTATKVDLSTVLNRTVCPIKIEIHVDEDRIPKRIKLLKCDRDPNLWCAKMHIPKHECCQHQHDNVKLECVEIQDMVQVYYPKLGQAQQYPVSVGCTCVMQDTAAVSAPAPAR